MSTPTTASAAATTLPHYQPHPHHYPPYSHSFEQQPTHRDPNQAVADSQHQQQHHNYYHHDFNYGQRYQQQTASATSGSPLGSAEQPSVAAATTVQSVPTTGPVRSPAVLLAPTTALSSTSVIAPSTASNPAAAVCISSTTSAVSTNNIGPSTSASSMAKNSNNSTSTSNVHDTNRSTSIGTAGSTAAFSSASTVPPPTTLPSLNPNGHGHQHHSSSAISTVVLAASPSLSLSLPLSSRFPPPYPSISSPYSNSFAPAAHSYSSEYHQPALDSKRPVYNHDSYDYDHHNGQTSAYTLTHHRHSTSIQSPIHPSTPNLITPTAHYSSSNNQQQQQQQHQHQEAHHSYHNSNQLPLLSPAAHSPHVGYSQQQQHLQRPHRPSPLTNIAHNSASGHYISLSGHTSAVSTPISAPGTAVTLPPLSSLPSVSGIPSHSHRQHLGHLPSVTPTVTASSDHHHSPYHHNMPEATKTVVNTPTTRRRRSRDGPDWNEFYKNGLPKEVIVIEDTPEPQSVPSQNYTSNVAPSQQPIAEAQSAKRKRREDDDVADPLYHNTKYSASHTSTPRYHATPTSHSERTSALLNSSATSMSAHELEHQQSGNKRRRTRGQLSEARIKEHEFLVDSNYVTYHPPPYPPRKAPDVPIRVIDDQYHRRNRVDDADGHYIVVPDADLTERYKIIKLLGQGTFGKVVQARDNHRNKLVAIKIIRSVQKYRDASKIELRVLATLKANDEENRNRCIHLRDTFDFRNHICIVMDLLGQSVFDFLKGNSFVPFPNSQIQNFARQLLTSVAFLHDLNLIHTDLKPENILLCDNAYQTFTYNRKIPSASVNVCRTANQRRVLLDTEIRLIDFGSATFQEEYHSSVVSTRHYRAPEIILGLGWSYPCDIWSIGCILVEFFTGDALFQTHDNLEHLAMMEAVVDSRIDTHLIQMVHRNASRSNSSSSSPARFFKRYRLDFPTAETTRASKRFVKAMKKLDDIIPANNQFLKLFLDLLKKIFVYDPNKRITAKEALQHPWFREHPIPDDGTEALKIRAERMRSPTKVSHNGNSHQLPQYAGPVPSPMMHEHERLIQ